MRIAQMLDTLNWGGAQKMQLSLIETLCPLGIEVTVIGLNDSFDSLLTEKMQASGAKVVIFPFPKLFRPRSFFQIVKYLRHEKFDLLHGYLTYSNIIGPLAGVLTGTPTIASLRNADFERKGYTPQRELLETFMLRHVATRVMANGEVVAKFARQRLKNSRPVDVITNAVDCLPSISEDEREKLRRDLIGDAKRPFVLSVGRLTSQKGFSDLIDAFVIVHSQIPSAALVIAGGGDLMDELNAQINLLGMEHYVFLLGHRDDIPLLLAAADIYVNSSHYEGTPVSVLEAMASGLPVIATTVGENSYLLNKDTGLLVSPHQPKELANALIALLSSREKCREMGQAGSERIRHNYSIENWRRKMLELYAQITPSAKPFLAMVSPNSKQVEEV